MKKMFILLSLVLGMGITSGYGQQNSTTEIKWGVISFNYENGIWVQLLYEEIEQIENSTFFLNCDNGKVSVSWELNKTSVYYESANEFIFCAANFHDFPSPIYVYDGKELKELYELSVPIEKIPNIIGAIKTVTLNALENKLYFRALNPETLKTDTVLTINNLDKIEFIAFGPNVPEIPVDTGIDDVNDASTVYYANGTLNIESSSVISTVTVYSLMGSVVKTFTVNANTFSADANLPKGMYLVKFGTTSAKIVVQ